MEAARRRKTVRETVIAANKGRRDDLDATLVRFAGTDEMKDVTAQITDLLSKARTERREKIASSADRGRSCKCCTA